MFTNEWNKWNDTCTLLHTLLIVQRFSWLNKCYKWMIKDWITRNDQCKYMKNWINSIYQIYFKWSDGSYLICNRISTARNAIFFFLSLNMKWSQIVNMNRVLTIDFAFYWIKRYEVESIFKQDLLNWVIGFVNESIIVLDFWRPVHLIGCLRKKRSLLNFHGRHQSMSVKNKSTSWL